MKACRCSLLILCAVALSLRASGKISITTLTFDFSGHHRLVYLVVPQKDVPLPVLVLLHGSGRNGEIMAQAWRDLAIREGFIIAAPDAFDRESWNSSADPPPFFHALIDQVKAIHAVDDSRIYLFGHSAGAAYALFLAVKASDLFAATAIHAGALQADPRGFFEQAERKMPIAIWVGDHDSFFPVETVEATRRLFAENGFPIRVNLIPNHDHYYYGISDEINRKAWTFLNQTRLETSALQKPTLTTQHRP